jgi:hypothetical protein
MVRQDVFIRSSGLGMPVVTEKKIKFFLPSQLHLFIFCAGEWESIISRHGKQRSAVPKPWPQFDRHDVSFFPQYPRPTWV